MKLYGLLGKKLGHSFSKGYFSEKFQQMHLEARYENFELAEISQLSQILEIHPELCGLNVTIPYKEQIIPLLDELSATAQAISAVNVVQIKHGKLIGHNTDMIGFRDSLSEIYQPGPGGTALVLGSGGASKAVIHALAHFFAFDEILVVSRSAGKKGQIAYADLSPELLAKTLLVVNTTPLGMFPDIDAKPAIDLTLLPKECLVFDLIYNPAETKLMQAAKTEGLATMNGLDMLVRQAEAAWAIWESK